MIKTLVSKFSEKENTFFLLLTIAVGIAVVWPLHNFQHYLAQGDHGRDLYCFKKTMEGSLPYRDYSWLFGPLMPYYYSLFYLIGGVSIQSVLFGQGLLILLVGVFTYLSCAVFLSPALSFICALWYWGFRGTEFFYTYNHVGGLLTLLITLYCLLQYIKNNRLFYIYFGFFNIFLLMLIRLNMGASTLIAFVSSLFLINFVQKNAKTSRRRKLFLTLSLIVITVTSLIYWFLLHPLPNYAIAQSFPYGRSQRTDYSGSSLGAMAYSLDMIASYFNATISQKIFVSIIFLALIQSIILLFSKKQPKEFRKNTFLILCSLFLFLIFSSHEFIASGVYYRLFWIFPLIYITIFTLIGISTKNISSPFIKALILLTFFFPAIVNIKYETNIINSFKTPEHMFHIGRNKIYTTQKPQWIQTVRDATRFIKNNIAPDEKILVLPLDPLYLFLGERNSATRQLVFFEHINIKQEQEQHIIAEMEETGANWAIISSRAASPERGMGVFGQTYCPRLAEYLNNHFKVVATFGDWKNPPGWAWNHGVKILRRIKDCD